jgi:hypothetical protein
LKRESIFILLAAITLGGVFFVNGCGSNSPTSPAPTHTPVPPTAAPTPVFNWQNMHVSRFNDVGSSLVTVAQIDLQVAGQPLTTVNVVLSGSGVSAPATLTYIRQDTIGSIDYAFYYYTSSFTYTPGQTYILTTTSGANVAAVTMMAPGGITNAADGSQASWAINGNSNIVRVAQGTNITYSNVPTTSPLSIPGSAYSLGGTFDLFTQIGNSYTVTGAIGGNQAEIYDYLETQIVVATHTPTFTATATYTPTATPTPTITDTPTATPTTTFTGTPTGTATSSGTPTFSGTPTQTGTSTPSGTPTFSGTPTKTGTFTPSGTPTFSGTPTSTSTSTYTFTSTNTFTPTNTRTHTNTPTVTRTPTPSSTYTFTPTYTSTATFTFTSTPTICFYGPTNWNASIGGTAGYWYANVLVVNQPSQVDSLSANGNDSSYTPEPIYLALYDNATGNLLASATTQCAITDFGVGNPGWYTVPVTPVSVPATCVMVICVPSGTTHFGVGEYTYNLSGDLGGELGNYAGGAPPNNFSTLYAGYNENVYGGGFAAYIHGCP